MALCNDYGDPVIQVKLQLSYRHTNRRQFNGWPTRIVVRLCSSDVVEVCRSEQSGMCWMGLLRNMSWRTHECYETLQYILKFLGLDPLRVLGTIDSFRCAGKGLLVWNLPQQSIAYVCNAGRCAGWPWVVNDCGQSMYFSDSDAFSGMPISWQHLRRLDHPEGQVGQFCTVTMHETHEQTEQILENMRETCVVCESSVYITDIDIHGLPSNVGPGFESMTPAIFCSLCSLRQGAQTRITKDPLKIALCAT